MATTSDVREILQRRLASLQYLRSVSRCERAYLGSVFLTPVEVAACAPGGANSAAARARVYYTLALSIGRVLSLTHPLLLLRAACQLFHELEQFSGDGAALAGIAASVLGTRDDPEFFPCSLPLNELAELYNGGVRDTRDGLSAPIQRAPVRTITHRAVGVVVYEFLLIGRAPCPFASLDVVEVLSSLLEALEELYARLLEQTRRHQRSPSRADSSATAGGSGGGSSGGIGTPRRRSELEPGAASAGRTSDAPSTAAGQKSAVSLVSPPPASHEQQQQQQQVQPLDDPSPPPLQHFDELSYADAPGGEDAILRLDRHVKHYVVKRLTLELEAAAQARVNAAMAQLGAALKSSNALT